MNPWTLPRRAMPATLLWIAVVAAACGGTVGSAPPVASSALSAASTPASPSSAVASASAAPSAIPSAAASPVAIATTPPTQALIDFLTDRVAQEPTDGEAQRDLGLAILQRIRETADPSRYAAAEAALTTAHQLRPKDPLVGVGIGGLELGRHEFARALKTGQAVLKLLPGYAPARGVVVDALIELGHYDEAFRDADRLAADAPDLATLARLSYARELRGDLPGALEAMREAAASPGLAPENTAYVTALTGHLERLSGDPDAARASYEAAIALVPDHPPSLAGLGRLAIADGDLTTAAARFERAAAVVPLPEYVIALGEVREAAGDQAGARRQYDLARAEIQLFQAGGVVVDQELALFEADHGDPATALDLARKAYDATTTIKSADAVAWALHRLGRDDEAAPYVAEALRLGSVEPSIRFHAGAIEAARGDVADARRDLTMALTADPGFSATGAAEAKRLLDALPG
jgi:tetratricopeptide (TPR) repeat protein